MSDEKKEGRVNIEDLPESGQELSPEEARDVKGGGYVGSIYVASGDVNNDAKPDTITSTGAGAGPHVKAFDGKS